MSETTFKPFDDSTVSLSVSPSSERIAFNERHNGATCRIVNSGSDLVFIKFGGADVVAGEDDIPMLGNTVEVFAVPDGATYCAAVASASPAVSVLYITPGDGD